MIPDFQLKTYLFQTTSPDKSSSDLRFRYAFRRADRIASQYLIPLNAITFPQTDTTLTIASSISPIQRLYKPDNRRCLPARFSCDGILVRNTHANSSLMSIETKKNAIILTPETIRSFMRFYSSVISSSPAASNGVSSSMPSCSSLRRRPRRFFNGFLRCMAPIT